MSITRLQHNRRMLVSLILGARHKSTHLGLQGRRILSQIIQPFSFQKFQSSGSEIGTGLSHDKGSEFRMIRTIQFHILQGNGQENFHRLVDSVLRGERHILQYGDMISLGPQIFEAIQYYQMLQTIRKGGSGNGHGGDHFRTPQLLDRTDVFHQIRQILTIWFDAANVPCLGDREGVHQSAELVFEFGPDRFRDNGRTSFFQDMMTVLPGCLTGPGTAFLFRCGRGRRRIIQWIHHFVIGQFFGKDSVGGQARTLLQITGKVIHILDDKIGGIIDDFSRSTDWSSLLAGTLWKQPCSMVGQTWSLDLGMRFPGAHIQRHQPQQK